MVSWYSPMAMVLPFRSEALALVGVVLVMSTMLEHWKYFFDSSSMRAKSLMWVLSPMKATDEPLVTTGLMRSTM